MELLLPINKPSDIKKKRVTLRPKNRNRKNDTQLQFQEHG